MKAQWSVYLSLVLFVAVSRALDNGLARTPPMGWLTWERFECNTDCKKYPNSCIGEKLLKQMADLMVSQGYKEAGYEYIAVDDCWPEILRDDDGKLVPDHERFPSGIKSLSDYMHSKGLKFGIYADVGIYTCAAYPGSQGHYDTDARTFSEWGVDFVKFDGCNANETELKNGYPTMAKSLNQTGRPILYSCEWPLYERGKGVKPNYTLIAEWCNTYRVYTDIFDSFSSVRDVIKFYGDNKGNFLQSGGPGHFTDADMLVIGDFGLSADEERVQFGMWSMFPSPLIMSVDLRTIGPRPKALLLNRRLIEINQDPLGIPGRRVFSSKYGEMHVWTRQVAPQGSYAVSILYDRTDGYPVVTSHQLASLGLKDESGYNLTELFDAVHLGIYKASQNITCRVNPSGIYMFKAVPLTTLKYRKFDGKQRVQNRDKFDIL